MNKIFEIIKQNPGRIFGLVYPYVLVIATGIGMYYLTVMNDIARQSVPPLRSGTPAVGDLKIVEAKSVPPVDILKLMDPTPELLEKGKVIYFANCSSCHGDDGNGAGPASVGLNPAPKNFTVNENWKNGSALTGLYQTLQEGIPGSGMIAYDFIIPEERIALAHYIRSAYVANPPVNSKDELIALDQTYNLSKGTEIPAQIPVKAAINLFADKYSNKQKSMSILAEQIKLMSIDGGNRIFLRVTHDPVKALTSLSNSSGWKVSEEYFVKSVITNANQNGFNGSVYNLSRSEWTILYDFISKML